VSEAGTGDKETASTLTGIACGGGAAAASCLHPDNETPSAALAASESTNFKDFEDTISDKGLSPHKLHRTTVLLFASVVLRKIGRDRKPQDAQI
jgi:hypothetical protein